MLSGRGDWSAYASVDTSRFWSDWQGRTPLSTRFAVYFSFAAAYGYGLFLLFL